MSRISGLLVVTLVLGALAAWTVRVDSDARALLGDASAASAALDSTDGRAVTLAIVSPDRDRRSAIARQVASDLAGNPMVASALLAPPAPSAGLLDWLWRYRLALAPPPAGAFAPAALEAEMRRAREALTEVPRSALAPRYLLDPTGSFRRLVEGLMAASRQWALPVHDGVAQARDDSAALVLIELADGPFDATAQSAFDEALRERIAGAGAEALLVGPRPIAAEISRDIATRSTLCTIAAVAVLLAWLAVVLRSARGILACALPAAAGTAAAALIVQAVYGAVHILALGFGGALMGLAVDYPIHLMVHRGQDQAHVRRCVRLGAATTAIAFLSLVFAGVPALAQVGVFVAAGLAVAAGAALWMGRDLPPVRPGRVGTIRVPCFAQKVPVLIGISLLLAIGVWLLPGKGAGALVPTTPTVRASIERLDRMVGLPSGRYRIEVTGDSLGAVLAAERRLAPTLGEAEGAGLLTRTEMLADHLPGQGGAADLPTPEALSNALSGRLAAAGLRPAFESQIVAAYAEALEHREVRPADARPVADDPAVSKLVRVGEGLFRAPVLLWDVSDPAAIAARISAMRDPAVRFVDREAEIAGGIDRLTDRVRLCLAAGILAAIGFLVAAAGRGHGVLEIVLGCAAAALATALVAGLIGGGLGIFHVMALALVIGIGIDYGLLLTLGGEEEFGAALRSVAMCATTTLIAFVIMALSGVEVLEDIGTTVALGVLATVAVSAVRRRPR